MLTRCSARGPFTPSSIKLEDQIAETITDIQNYVDSFTKEIPNYEETQKGLDGFTLPIASEGTCFMDTLNHYLCQSENDNQKHKVESKNVPEIGDQLIERRREEVCVDIRQNDRGSDATILSLKHSEDGVTALDTKTYQTLGIVPSDARSGDLGYVLLVEPEHVEDKGDCEVPTVNSFDKDGTEVEVKLESVQRTNKIKYAKVTTRKYSKSHFETHAHMCNICNYTSPKRYLLSRHMKSHSDERPHKCSICERGFKTYASLQNHINTHTGRKPHRCLFCGSAFTTSGELGRHVRYKHTHEKPHKCTECEYASVELSKLKRHIRCHTGERPYQCPHCTYASPDTFKLKRHLRTHTGERPYLCDICQSRFTQSNSLKAHKLIHFAANKPVFRCELCPATCGRKTDLRIHVQKLHTSEVPVKCRKCGKSFPDRYTYKVHNRSHKGEKCFKCYLCPYASISQRHLDSHMLVHTDQKPYRCDECDQAFRQKQLLKRHENLYHNPDYVPPQPREKKNICPECERAFRHQGNLRRHMAMHDPESSLHERKAALRLGRQKKIHFTQNEELEDKQQNDEEVDDVVAVEDEDGQQYVVLEMIDLQNGKDEEQTLALVGEETEEANQLLEEAIDALTQGNTESLLTHLTLPDTNFEESVTFRPVRINRFSRKDAFALTKSLEIKMDLQNCFGFDEDDEEEEEMPQDKEIARTATQLVASQ